MTIDVTESTLVLGIESSCDETAAAVVDVARRVRSSVVASQATLHAGYGGVVPEIAGRAHVERIVPVVRAALAEAGCTFDDIAAIAVGNRPGLIGSLLVGLAAAKAIAWARGLPLIGVDHVHAHLDAALLQPANAEPDDANMLFPAIGLVVSGGHTAIYRCDSRTDITRLGATIDDAVGECFDKAATVLELGYPGGPEIDRLSREPGADDRAVDLPISRLGKDSLDMSFSGLKTALLYAAKGKPRPEFRGGGLEPVPPLTPERVRDLAACVQRAAVDAVILKLERAFDAMPDARSLIAGGGVTANTRLRAELTSLAKRRDLPLRIPAMTHCIDNAAMIAGLGGALLAAGRTSELDLAAVPTTAC